MTFTWPNAKDEERKLLGAIKILLGNDPALLTFLLSPDSPRLRRRAGILKEDSWSLGLSEQLLVRAALDLWSGSGHLQLWEMIENWEPREWTQFIRSIQALGLDGGTSG